MLIIRRRTGQSVLVGGDVEIEIIEASHGRVKLGIRAPESIRILRKEVLLATEQNRAAAGGAEPEAIAWLAARLAESLPQA